MRHLRVSCLCFCWTPMVTSPKLHGQSRLSSTAAKKLHSTASAWENFCEIITCRRRTLTFPWERLSLDPSPTLRSTLRVFRLLFNVHSCCALHHEIATGSSPGEKASSPNSVCLSTSADIRFARIKARSPMGQEQAYAGCPFRAGPDHVSDTNRGSMPARRRVEPSDGHRFLYETQSSARGRWR